MTLILREDDVRHLLPMNEAIDAVKTSFRLLGIGEAKNGRRERIGGEGFTLNVMAAASSTLGAMGVKSYPIVRSDVTQGSSFTYLHYGLPDGNLEAILEADNLGQIRTGAASAVATMYLAREDAATLCIIGTGWQARSQIAAVASVLPKLERVLVVGRSKSRTTAFTDWIRSTLDLEVLTSAAADAVPRADVLITATGSSEPVFDGALLSPGCHINAMGSNVATKRELDATTIIRADRIVADAVDVAILESGDLIANDVAWDRLEELGDIVAGRSPGRTHGDEITLFESHGLAVQDLACAVRVVQSARTSGLGGSVPG